MIYWLIVSIVWACICYAVAKLKGFDTILWTILGFFFGIITLIIMLCLKGSDASSSQTSISINQTTNYDDTPVLKYSYASNNQTVGSNDWRCPDCSRINPSYLTTCHCGRTKPNKTELSQLGKWQCPNCGNVNPTYITTCQCGKTKPDKIESNQIGTWICSNCGKENPNNIYDCSCGLSKKYNDKWQCYYCGRINENSRYICYCGTKQSDSKKVRPIPIINNAPEQQALISQTQQNSLSEIEKIEAITKYKQLMDMGVLSESEFEKKKTELL